MVNLVQTKYASGVNLGKEAMTALEAQITRHTMLGKWFLDSDPPTAHPMAN